MNQDFRAMITRRRIVMLLVLCFILFIFYLLLNYSLVRVSVESKNRSVLSSEKFTIKNGEKQIADIEINSEKSILLRRGDHLLTITNGREETQAQVAPKFVTDKLSIAVGAQAKVDKIASESQGCGLENNSVAFSWECEGDDASIFRHSYTLNGLEKTPVSLPALYSKKTYKDGFLGIGNLSDNSQPNLVYVSLSSQQPQLNVLPGTYASDKSDARIVVDSSDDSTFAVIDYSDGSYSFYNGLGAEPINGSVNGKDGNNNKPSSCSLSKGKFYCFVGKSSENLDDHGQETASLDNKIRIWAVNAVGGNQTQIKAKGKVPASEIAVANDYLFFVDLKKITIFKLGGDTASKQGELALSRGGSLTVNQGSVYVLKENALFTYKPEGRSLRLIYRNPGYTLSALDGNRFTAFRDAEGVDQRLDTFRFDESSLPSYPRIESALPVPSERNSIRKIDYSDKTIYVQVELQSYIQDKIAGKVHVDESEFSDKKAAVSKILQDSGVDLSKYSISYSY